MSYSASRNSKILAAFFGLIASQVFEKAAEAAAINNVVALQQAQIEELKREISPVGTIVYSYLSLSSFQQLRSKDWVMMEGQVLSETDKLCKILKSEGRSCKLPDMRGRFIRSAGGRSAPIGEPQGQATAPNNMKAVTTRTANSNVSVSGNVGGHLENSGDLLSPYRIEFQYADRTGAIQTSIGFTGSGTASGGAWTTTLTNEVNDETRPDNVAVNTFIRIN